MLQPSRKRHFIFWYAGTYGLTQSGIRTLHKKEKKESLKPLVKKKKRKKKRKIVPQIFKRNSLEELEQRDKTDESQKS